MKFENQGESEGERNCGGIIKEVAELMCKMNSMDMKMTVIKPILGQHRRDKSNGTWIRDQGAITKMAERHWMIGTQGAREDWTAPSVIDAKKPCLKKLPVVICREMSVRQL